ncbi:hypothetical protein FKR81_19730 [Lentzea tibetensis]|uniref:DUF4386 family protein n=1 Tax=Lentzea tibetensis TaxID=2591470 RepID=A0A563ES45_9PSEU|nr:hypothetical protein [Lentzea tibetensis]TWP50412.1 hypothetical protein FKR81_19730 [Lentzea tibetensis]
MTAGLLTAAPRTRRPSRWLAAALLPVGPAAIAVLRLVIPYDTTDSPAAAVAKVAADPDAMSLAVWLGLVGMLTMVPAVLWVAGLTRAAAPRTTAAAVLLLVPAYLSLGVLLSGDAVLLFGVREGLPDGVTAQLFDGASVHPAIAVAGLVFIVGHVFGTVLLGVAMWSSRAVPRWAAVATLVSQPLHFVAAVVIVSHPLDLVAWGLNAAGFAAAAIALLRQPPAE